MAHEHRQDPSVSKAPVPDLEIVHQRPGDASLEEQLRDMVYGAIAK